MLSICFLAQAQAQERRFFRSWTTRSGMPTNSFLDIDFDARGFLWAATEAGTIRFDGVSVKTYRLEGQSDGLHSRNRMAYVFAHKLPHIFVANINGELFGLDEKLDSFGFVAQIWSLDKGKRKLAIFPTVLSDPQKNRLLIADDQRGLVAFSLRTHRFDTLLAGPLAPSHKITVDSSGAIWLSNRKGLFRVAADGQPTAFFSGQNFAGGMADSSGVWFVENGKAVHRFDRKTGLFSSKKLDFSLFPAFGDQPYLVAECIDAAGLIWVYSDSDGVFLVDPVRGAVVDYLNLRDNERDGFLSNLVISIKKRGDELWLGTLAGMLRTSPNQQRFFYRPLELPENKSIFRVRQHLNDPTRPGHAWVATNNSGLVLVDERAAKVVRTVRATGPESETWNRFNKITRSPGGRIFCSTVGGLLIVDPRTGGIEKHVVRSPNFAKNNQPITDCWFDDAGQIWVQTYKEIGLFDLKKGLFSPISGVGNLPTNQIFGVQKSQKDRVWLATYEGAFEVSMSEKRVIRSILATGSEKAQIQAVVEDNLFVWLATLKGFLRFEKKTEIIKNYGLEQGLSDLTIKSLVADKRGKLWMNTQNGLFLFDPTTEKFIRFSQKDGLPENNLPGILTEDGGLFCAGTERGYVLFRPVAEVDRRTRPPVLTDFFVLGKRRPIVLGQKTTLRFSENVLEFAFSCPDFDGGDRQTFERQLVGFDPRPVANGIERKATYTNLDAGRYQLNIWAINADGFRCAVPAVFDFEVLPPFHQTWWFRVLVAAFLAFLMWSIMNFRLRQRIEKEKIRLQIARDLHDDVGSTLSTISILSSAAMLQTDQNLAQKRLSTISEKSREALFGISDIVWAVNPENDQMQKVIERMALFATETVENAGIALVFKADESLFSIKMGMAARRDFYLFFKEAVANASRHSGASRIEIHFLKAEKGLTLRILDNGKGFDPAAIEKSRFGGNGLGNLRARAEAMGGLFSISSAAGEGCRVELRVPSLS